MIKNKNSKNVFTLSKDQKLTSLSILHHVLIPLKTNLWISATQPHPNNFTFTLSKYFQLLKVCMNNIWDILSLQPLGFNYPYSPIMSLPHYPYFCLLDTFKN